MYKPYYAFIGSKYTHVKRKNHFISFISITSMLGIALGVMVLITVISVMNGFGKEIRSVMLSVTPHITVTSTTELFDWQDDVEKFLQHKKVIGATPFTQAFGLITHKKQVQPIEIKGIDPAQINKVYPIAENIIAGKLTDLTADTYGVALGVNLANHLGVWVGDKVNLLVPKAKITPAGIFPRMRSLEVVGIFESGTIYDSKSAFVHLSTASKLLSLKGAISGIQLRITDPIASRSVAHELAAELPVNYILSDWRSKHSDFLEAIQMEKTVMWCLLVLIISVAVFNLLSSLVMLVADKKTDIAILRTMGATRRAVMAIFMIQGTIIGVVGTLMGLISGLLLSNNITKIVDWIQGLFNIQFLSNEIYYISYVPSDIQSFDVILICAVSLVLSFLATIYPSFRAASIQPAEALRYE